MKKNLKVALYDPYLDILGGGEKHILSILKVLNEEGDEINIFWDKNLQKEIDRKFSLQCFKTLKFIPNIFLNHKPIVSTLKTLRTLRTFDYFFYLTDGSYFFSSARKNFIFCMIPQKNLYRMNFLNKLKTINYKFISNSKYTHDWLEKWGIKNDYIYPYIDDVFFSSNKMVKKKIILSVGRFFPHLHTKQHKIIIDIFKRNFKDFKLILAGAVKEEDKNYFNKLKNLAKNDPSIIFKPNVSFNELYKLYKLSTFFWHFTGYGVNEDEHPEMVEHLGIAPLEAMASGCLTFCYNAGGPKEIIKNGENGFLFSSEDDLINKTLKTLSVFNNYSLHKKITTNAQKFVKENFSYEIFKERVKEVLAI